MRVPARLIPFGILLTYACETQDPVPLPNPDAAVPMDAAPTPQPDAEAPRPDIGPDVGFVRPDAGNPIPDAGFPPEACTPALSVQPATPTTLPLGLITLVAEGGTGDYRFTLTQDESGAVLNETSGAYLSGTVSGVEDQIAVTDTGCVGTATVTVTIVNPMIVQPANVELAPMGRLTFVVSEGSGRFRFQLQTNASGGSITTDGIYQAGRTPGTDRVRVSDLATGEETDALIRVVEGARLRPVPPRVVIPVASSYRLDIRGGSGVFDIMGASSEIMVTEGVATVVRPGTTTLRVQDRFTRQTTQITAIAVAPQTHTATRAGDYQFASAVVSGDFDGDGFVDAAIGWAEADIDAVDSGAVFIYRGTGTGLEPAPARVISGVGRFSQFGRSMVAADFNNDGLTDIAVGAWRADVGAVNNGGVYIYDGVQGRLLSDEPSRILGGLRAFDESGFAVEACDFNADGRQDLVVGAWRAEDRNRRTVRSDQGSVAMYLGNIDGFLDTPDITLWGDLPQPDGTYAGVAAMRLGASLATGDFNGDGACDLAAGSYVYRPNTNSSNDGIVLIFDGVAADANQRGGLEPLPSRGWAAGVDGDRASQFARFLAAGDMDGDGRAELAVSNYLTETMPGLSQNRGGIRVYQGVESSTSALAVLGTQADADFTWIGDTNNDQSGWYPRIRDYDGDMLGDLWVGNLNDEVPGSGRNDTGSIAFWPGQRGLLPVDGATPTTRYAAGNPGDRFGTAFDVFPDLDGDMLGDLVVWSALSDVYGRDVGVPWMVPTGENATPVRLEHPGDPAGYQMGRGADFVGDVNNDGFEDVIAGARLADPPQQGVNSGAAYLYLGSATGVSERPALEIIGFPGHSSGDNLAFKVAAAGDFNNDGIDDFAIMSRSDDKPTTLNTNTYSLERQCNGRLNNSGAIYVFLGADGALPSTRPAFVWFGPQANDVMWELDGGFDSNGDGFDDLIIGGNDWDRSGRNTVGGFAIVAGRAKSQGNLIDVICDAELTWLGLSAGDSVGRAVSKVGDIDGDGCDEVAAGGYLEDEGLTNQGSVRVVFGWGTGCSTDMPMMVTLRSLVSGAQAGYSMDGGLDVDGDAIPDLVVGGVGVRRGNDTTGGVFLSSGAYLAGLAREAIVDDMMPTMTFPLVDPNTSAIVQIEGTAPNERFGSAVALVPNGSAAGRAGVAVGGINADFAGTPLAGGVRVYEYVLSTAPEITEGWSADPIAALTGETNNPGGFMGDWVAAGLVGRRAMVLGGGYQSAGIGLDQGAVYIVDVGR